LLSIQATGLIPPIIVLNCLRTRVSFWRKSVQGLHAAGGALRKALVGADLYPVALLFPQQFRALVIYQVAQVEVLAALCKTGKKLGKSMIKGRCDARVDQWEFELTFVIVEKPLWLKGYLKTQVRIGFEIISNVLKPNTIPLKLGE
jgi:hypothetical protein